MFVKYVLPVVALALLVFAVFHVSRAQKATPPPAPTIQPARNPFPKTVAGAGLVEPQTENISVGAPEAGIAVEVYVKVGQQVQKNDPLFRMDDRPLKAELEVRKAAAAAAKAELVRLENQPRAEQLLMGQAQVLEAEANVASHKDQLKRTKDLFARRMVSEQDLIAHTAALRASEAQLARVKAEYAMTKAGAWEYDKRVARVAVEQAQTQIHEVETRLDRLQVRALEPGQVLKVDVRPGEFVGAPADRPLLMLGNVDQLHVRVDIDEYDIHRFKPGAPARAMLKGQPQQEFQLSFVRIEPFVIPKRSLTGDNTERVDTRVLQIIFAVHTDGKQLYVGQQVDVFIDASDASDTSAPSAPRA